ncbi:MAG: CDP-diacylglycerol--glycerol-3-phosphate 3-phosphatidyltransferase, partial [Elusimicrobia bacterium CG_4_8_14_3_um_filter_50_9]
MTLANKITFLRMTGIPFFVVMVSLGGFWNYTAATFIFVFLASTDCVDGIVARRRKEVTVLGEFMDPLADKLLVTSALVYFTTVAWLHVHWWMVVTIISREFIISGLRVLAARRKISIPALLSGKVKTTVQLTAVIATLLIIMLRSASVKWSFYYSHFDFIYDLPMYLMLFAVASTIYSGVRYIKEYFYLF